MKDQFQTLETDRLCLRQFKETDLENVFAALSNPDVIKYYGVSFESKEATKSQMQWYSDLESNGTGVWWALELKSPLAFVGGIGLNDLDKTHKKAEIGFWLLPEFWKQGILAEVMTVVLDHASNQLGLHRIEAYVEPENFNSKGVLQKFGFDHEGTLRDCEIKNGRFISLDIYARIQQ